MYFHVQDAQPFASDFYLPSPIRFNLFTISEAILFSNIIVLFFTALTFFMHSIV